MIKPATVVIDGTLGDKTAVVLGAWRGGTSMIARVLLELGVHMGDPSKFVKSDNDLGYLNYEDQEFNNALWTQPVLRPLQEYVLDRGREPTKADFEKGFPALRSLISNRNKEFSLWGWKQPASTLWFHYWTDLADILRQPHFITVWRDPLAVWQHEAQLKDSNGKSRWNETDANAIAADGKSLDPKCSLAYVMRQVHRLEAFLLNNRKHPHLLVSYERSVCGGAAMLVDAVSDFLCLSPTIEQKENAKNAVERRGR